MHSRYCNNCNGYIQDKRLKKCCRLCLDINKDTKKLDTAGSDEETQTQPITIEDKRIISRTVQINLCMLHDYFYQRYNITEDIEDVFNMWIKWSRAAAKCYRA